MSLFKIKINAGTPAAFDPDPLTVTVNDSVFWYNGDKVAHWPAPSAANPTGWLDYQIAPDGVSNQISLDPPGPYTLNYVCALHPGETGQIKVFNEKKAAFGGNTKKGAFGGKTKKGPYGRTTKRGAFGKTTR
jgi:plastocyanin